MSETPPEPVTIYVELLDEGTNVCRPVQATIVGSEGYLILPEDYDPQTETWEYPPGSVVQCKIEKWSNGEILIARTLLRQIG
jgi:hypothetical protein